MCLDIFAYALASPTRCLRESPDGLHAIKYQVAWPNASEQRLMRRSNDRHVETCMQPKVEHKIDPTSSAAGFWIAANIRTWAGAKLERSARVARAEF